MNMQTPIAIPAHPTAADLITACLADPDLFAGLTERSHPMALALEAVQYAYDGWCDATGHHYGWVEAVLPIAVREAVCSRIVEACWTELVRRAEAADAALTDCERRELEAADRADRANDMRRGK